MAATFRSRVAVAGRVMDKISGLWSRYNFRLLKNMGRRCIGGLVSRSAPTASRLED